MGLLLWNDRVPPLLAADPGTVRGGQGRAAARDRFYQVTGHEEVNSSHKRMVFMALMGNCTPLPLNAYLLLRALVDPGAESVAESNLTAGGRCPGTWRVVLRPGVAGGSRPSDDERENQ